MNLVRGLLLGSAAGLLATAGAQAADLPVKAKPVEYVKICSLYGVGYYYIPGTSTCIKIGGYVRAEVNFGSSSGSHTTAINGDLAQGNRLANVPLFRTRSSTTFDIRNQTEYGTVRAFADLWLTYDGWTGVTSPSLNRGFIQFAGFTFGKLTSAVTAPWAGLPGTSAGRFMGADDFGSGVNGIQYTAQFGNGVSATIGLEDALYRRGNMYDRTDAISNPLATTFTAFSNGGFRFPDIVGNIQVTQSWGTAFLGAQASQHFPSYYTQTAVGFTTPFEREDFGSPGSEWGYAVTAGLNLLLPQLGAGDQMWIEATYTKGILGRLQGAAPFQTYGMYGSSSAGYQSLAFGYALDGVFNSTTLSSLELTSGWGVVGGIEHYWVPGRLRSSLFASYSSIDYGTNANAWLCSKYGVASVGAPASTTNGTFTAGSVCNFDFSTWQVGSRTIWTPVAGLDFTAEVLYTEIDQKHSGFLSTLATPVNAALKPPGVYELKDQGIVSGLLRVQRNW